MEPGDFIVCRLAAQGDVHQLFSGGRSVPLGYQAILFQDGHGLGLLDSGQYNSALILQALPAYNGGNATLYEVRDGAFEIEVVVSNLPDPSDINSRLLAFAAINTVIEDPQKITVLASKHGGTITAKQLGDSLRDDVFMLLDPIVACERREALFNQGVFHETTGFTICEYLNTTQEQFGLKFQGVSLLEFQGLDLGNDSVDLPAEENQYAAPANASDHAAPSAPAPQRGNLIAQSDYYEIESSPSPPSWPEHDSIDEPAPPPIQPAPPSGGPPQRPASPPTEFADPGTGKTVGLLRAELAKAFLEPDFFERFKTAHGFDEQFKLLREVDFERLLSDEKVAELCQMLSSGQFDLGWAASFFIRQQHIFNQDQLKQFQQMIMASRTNPGDLIMRKEAHADIVSSHDFEIQNLTEGDVDLGAPADRPQSDQMMRHSGHSYTPEPLIGREGSEGAFGRDSQAGQGRVYRPISKGDSYINADTGASFTEDASDTGSIASITSDLGASGHVELILEDEPRALLSRENRLRVTVANQTKFNIGEVQLRVSDSSMVMPGPAVFGAIPTGESQSQELVFSFRGEPSDEEMKLVALAYPVNRKRPVAFQLTTKVMWKRGPIDGECRLFFSDTSHSKQIGPDTNGTFKGDSEATADGQPMVSLNRRLLQLVPNPNLTQRERARNAPSERAPCPFCGSEVGRFSIKCNTCKLELPKWMQRQVMVLTPDRSMARSRLPRARLTLTFEGKKTELWLATGEPLKLGRRQDNDIVLRAYNENGQVDESRSTQISRVAGLLHASQGRYILSAINRHGVRYGGMMIPQGEDYHVHDDGTIEFPDKNGTSVAHADCAHLDDRASRSARGDGGSTSFPGAAGLMLSFSENAEYDGCVFLQRGIRIHDLLGRLGRTAQTNHPHSPELISWGGCIWLAPNTATNLQNKQSGERLALDDAQLLRLDADCEFDAAGLEVKLEIAHSTAPANATKA